MNINVTILLEPAEQLAFRMSAEEVATAVLAALDADPDKDTCTAAINKAPEHGAAGFVPPPPDLPSPTVT